jgi:hypothetical protein
MWFFRINFIGSDAKAVGRCVYIKSQHKCYISSYSDPFVTITKHKTFCTAAMPYGRPTGRHINRCDSNHKSDLAKISFEDVKLISLIQDLKFSRQ